MKIQDPGPETLQAAPAGNLAGRVQGQRDDAAGATQEILLKVAPQLGRFRGESAFTPWVWRITHNHLLTARTRATEHLAAFTRVSDAAAVFRAHPAYRAPDAMIPAIRAVLTQEGFLQRQNPQ